MVHDCMCGALKKESVCERLEAKKQEKKRHFLCFQVLYRAMSFCDVFPYGSE